MRTKLLGTATYKTIKANQFLEVEEINVSVDFTIDADTKDLLKNYGDVKEYILDCTEIGDYAEEITFTNLHLQTEDRIRLSARHIDGDGLFDKVLSSEEIDKILNVYNGNYDSFLEDKLRTACFFCGIEIEE